HRFVLVACADLEGRSVDKPPVSRRKETGRHDGRRTTDSRPASFAQEAAPMFSKRIALAMLGALLILATGTVPVSAARPARAVPTAERPLSPEEQAASDRKVAAALNYLASAQARSFGRVTLACATPDGEAPATTEPERDDLSAI